MKKGVPVDNAESKDQNILKQIAERGFVFEGKKDKDELLFIKEGLKVAGAQNDAKKRLDQAKLNALKNVPEQNFNIDILSAPLSTGEPVSHGLAQMGYRFTNPEFLNIENESKTTTAHYVAKFYPFSPYTEGEILKKANVLGYTVAHSQASAGYIFHPEHHREYLLMAMKDGTTVFEAFLAGNYQKIQKGEYDDLFIKNPKILEGYIKLYEELKEKGMLYGTLRERYEPAIHHMVELQKRSSMEKSQESGADLSF